MRNSMINPRLTYELVRRGVFRNQPVHIADVGMRHGLEDFWNPLKPDLDVIGFEPEQVECDRINALEVPHKQVCFPIALDSEPQTRRFVSRRRNNASSGYILHNAWWTHRFATNDEGSDPYAFKLPPRHSLEGENEEAFAAGELTYTDVETTTLTHFIADNGLACPDFLKIDTEGADYDVLIGAADHLSAGGILGVKIEYRFIPDRAGKLFHDIYSYLFEKGYFLMDIEINRASRRALPMPVAWNHTDQFGNPIGGPTEVGQPTDGDAVFFRDLLADDFKPRNDQDRHRVLKAAAMAEMFNLPDYAAELLLYYREGLAPLLDVDTVLDQLVPLGFPPPYPSFGDYVREQIRTVQRYRPPPASDAE